MEFDSDRHMREMKSLIWKFRYPNEEFEVPCDADVYDYVLDQCPSTDTICEGPYKAMLYFVQHVVNPAYVPTLRNPEEVKLQLEGFKYATELMALRNKNNLFSQIPALNHTNVVKRKKQKVCGAAKNFYNSWAWRKTRYTVLKMYGPTCMCCGSKEHIVVDHIKPRSKHPTLELDTNNLQILCNSCNMGKSNDDETDWRTKK